MTGETESESEGGAKWFWGFGLRNGIHTPARPGRERGEGGDGDGGSSSTSGKEVSE